MYSKHSLAVRGFCEPVRMPYSREVIRFYCPGVLKPWAAPSRAWLPIPARHAGHQATRRGKVSWVVNIDGGLKVQVELFKFDLIPIAVQASGS